MIKRKKLSNDLEYLLDTYESSFRVNNICFKSVFQCLVYYKAKTSKRSDLINRIMKTISKKDLLVLDKEIKPLDIAYWNSLREEMLIRATIQKFRCSKSLSDQLMGLDFDGSVTKYGGILDIPLLSSVKGVIEMEVM